MKHIKILIAVALMLSCRTFAAHAQNYITFINDGIKYHILSNENKTVETVQGSQVGVNGHVTIPATTTYNGEEYTVVQIGQLSFMNKSNLKSIDLPSTITSIGDFAFDRCDSLRVLRLPSSISYLGKWIVNTLDDLYISCHTPPKVDRSWGWYCNYVSRKHIPKGTYYHYKVHMFDDYWGGLVEDETLGVYCDIDRNITGAGSIELDSTVVMTNADGFYFVPGGTDLTFTLRPEPKYMIKHVSLNETDITHQLGYGVTLFEDAPNLDLSDKLTEEVSYTISNIQEAVAINVDYAKNPYSKLSMRQGEGGTLSVRMHCDEPVLMTIVADDENTIDDVTMNGEPALINDKSVVAVPNLDDPVTIQVNYQQSED